MNIWCDRHRRFTMSRPERQCRPGAGFYPGRLSVKSLGPTSGRAHLFLRDPLLRVGGPDQASHRRHRFLSRNIDEAVPDHQQEHRGVTAIQILGDLLQRHYRTGSPQSPGCGFGNRGGRPFSWLRRGSSASGPRLALVRPALGLYCRLFRRSPTAALRDPLVDLGLQKPPVAA